jgi:hypothetical protein
VTQTLDGVEQGEEKICSDAISASLAERWRRDEAKTLEHKPAALLEAAVHAYAQEEIRSTEGNNHVASE